MNLSKNTFAERVDQLSTNMKEQLLEKGKDLITDSLAVDESTNTTDIPQLSIFIRRVDFSLSATEEFLYGTPTGQDLYEEVSRCFPESGETETRLSKKACFFFRLARFMGYAFGVQCKVARRRLKETCMLRLAGDGLSEELMIWCFVFSESGFGS